MNTVDSNNFRYIVCDAINGSFSNVWKTAFAELHQANNYAAYRWNHLSEEDKKTHHIYVVRVNRSQLNISAFDYDFFGDKVCDWTDYSSFDDVDGAFNKPHGASMHMTAEQILLSLKYCVGDLGGKSCSECHNAIPGTEDRDGICKCILNINREVIHFLESIVEKEK